MFFVSLFFLSLCFSLYVLGRSAMTFSLGNWPHVVNVLWDPVAQSPLSPELGAPGMLLAWVMWALLLKLSFGCYWPFGSWG